MKKYTLLPIVLLAASQVNAAGFQLVEHSVTGLGRAYAGEAAQTDSALAIIRNPALMAAFDKPTLSIGGHYVMPTIDAEGTNSIVDPDTGNIVPGTTVSANASDIAPSAFIPTFAYIHPINDKIKVGITMTSHFGMSTEYGDWAGSEHADFAEIHTYYLTPNVSYEIIDGLSVGLGVSYIYSTGHLKYSLSDTGAAAVSGTLPAPQGSTTLELEGEDDSSWGWNVGAFWQVNDRHSVGIKYQSETDIAFDGDVTILSMTPNAGEGFLPITLPQIIELGYVFKASDRLNISVGIQYTGWSSFDTLTAHLSSQHWDLTQPDVSVPGKEMTEKELRVYDWQDAMRYSVGIDYVLNEMVTLRGGLALDEAAADEHHSIALPDTDRSWYSMGASFNLKESGTIDAGLTYIVGDKVTLEDDSSVSTRWAGDISADALIVSLGYNYSF